MVWGELVWSELKWKPVAQSTGLTAGNHNSIFTLRNYVCFTFGRVCADRRGMGKVEEINNR